ncbi:hypothetical protein [Arenimonas caeni]|uniref:hypothetical protein n=1 Tax=Arenimonas caeni TaxID=2058085 RepID=UPI0019654530|nr:hypothetical protein [Arenimonas caeni]
MRAAKLRRDVRDACEAFFPVFSSIAVFFAFPGEVADTDASRPTAVERGAKRLKFFRRSC